MNRGTEHVYIKKVWTPTSKTSGWDFVRLGFCPLGFSPLGFCPLGFSPLGFCPLGFSPLGFCPLGFSPLGFCPLGFSPLGFCPSTVYPVLIVIWTSVFSWFPSTGMRLSSSCGALSALSTSLPICCLPLLPPLLWSPLLTVRMCPCSNQVPSSHHPASYFFCL